MLFLVSFLSSDSSLPKRAEVIGVTASQPATLSAADNTDSRGSASDCAVRQCDDNDPSVPGPDQRGAGASAIPAGSVDVTAYRAGQKLPLDHGDSEDRKSESFGEVYHDGARKRPCRGFSSGTRVSSAKRAFKSALVAACCLLAAVIAIKIWKCIVDLQTRGAPPVSAGEEFSAKSVARRLAEGERGSEALSGMEDLDLEDNVPGSVVVRSRFGVRRRTLDSLCEEMTLEEVVHRFAPPAVREAPTRVFEVDTVVTDLAARFTGHIADAEASMSDVATASGRRLREKAVHAYLRDIVSEFKCLLYTLEITPDVDVKTLPRKVTVMAGRGKAYSLALSGFKFLEEGVGSLIGGDVGDLALRTAWRGIENLRQSVMLVYLPDSETETEEDDFE